MDTLAATMKINPKTMVTMKTKHFLGMMAGAWMLAACSNQDELLQQEEVMTGQRVTVNAYVPDNTDSRLAFEDQGTDGLKVSWKDTGETFSVMTADEAAPVTFTQTEGSEFAGPQDFTFADGTQYYAFYPKLPDKDPNNFRPLTTVSAKAVPFYIHVQTGQLDESMNLMYAKRSADGDFQFKHMLAVMKFTLKGIKGELVDDVEIYFDSDSYALGKVDVTEGPTFTNDYDYNYVSIPADGLTPDNEGNYVIYAYLPPLVAGTWIEIQVFSEDEENYRKYYEYIDINENGIEAGKYYTAARTMDLYNEAALNYTAGNAEELKAWIKAVEIYRRVNLTLTDDIVWSDTDLEYDNDYDGTNDSNWPNTLSVHGTVDGGGHSITGIKINSGEDFQVAPFSINSTGVVKNLHLKDVEIRGRGAGGITHQNDGTISGCSVSGSVTALGSFEAAGGIAANNYGTVTGCYNVATVTGVDDRVGGIAGWNYGAITACYNVGALSATQPDEYATCIGGIVGTNNSTIEACYWSAEGANNGIGEDTNARPSDEGATKVDDESVTWNDAASAMNNALPADFGWKWEKNTDENTRTDIPLVLQNVAN